MKLKEKVEKIIEELACCDMRTAIGVDKARNVIRLALKEQDRDTRHECADAVQNAIINCRGGLE